VPSLQEQARALGDPTRYAIFRFIVDADDPVDVAALTDAFAFNHNAIRQHLAKLVDAELVVEETAARTGRGRPRLVYQPHPRADSRWGATGPYERLALLLSEMVRTGDAPEVVGHRAGVAAVGEFAPGTDAVDVVAGFMERNGFEPTVTTRGSRVEVVLDTCPFASAALADPDIVCAMHLGLAHGIADEAAGEITVEELVRKDPYRAGCRLRMRTAAKR
jgi:predicted ArsR family transcriptional regulator